jgi:nitroreductase
MWAMPWRPCDFGANLYGWGMTLLTGTADRDIERLLGLDRTDWPPLEEEHPELLAWVHPTGQPPANRQIPASLIAAAAAGPLVGAPNRLSPAAVRWDAIYETAAATAVRDPETIDPELDDRPSAAPVRAHMTAAAIIRRRRSATAFDPEGRLSGDRLKALLDRTLPRRGHAPFDVGIGPARVHLVLFVHSVDAIPAGLYLLVRNPCDRPDLVRDLDPRFAWEQVETGVPLYRLEAGDLRLKAIEMSCHQEIAGYGVFSLGMLARFGETVRRRPHDYRRLFWEAGMIGQVLYLEAEAQGIRGTGIGCYFDDEVHRLLGLRDDRWQSLYHFTVGCPVEDPRLTTLPPYQHLER